MYTVCIKPTSFFIRRENEGYRKNGSASTACLALLYTKSKTNGWPAAISRGYHIVIDLTTAVCTALASTVYIP